MTTKEKLRALVDELPEDRLDEVPPEKLAEAERMLRDLVPPPAKHPLITLLENAPDDPDPYTEEEQRQDEESRAAYLRGEYITHAEMGRRMKARRG